MLALIKEIDSDKFHPQLDEMRILSENLISYVAHAYVGVNTSCLESKMKYSPQCVAKRLANMAQKGPLVF